MAGDATVIKILVLKSYRRLFYLKNMQEIKAISALDTYTVRHPVLRPGKPIESCHFNGDGRETTKHFGFYENRNLIGVISLFEFQNAAFVNKKQYQIRGMAILKNRQNKGIGEKLMQHAEKDVRRQGNNFIWCNARETAVNFYRKLGYDTFGDAFEIAGIGTHYTMFKTLN